MYNWHFVYEGIIPSQATLFKSSLTPARLTFVRSGDSDEYEENYVTIFKHGDDLRQDQLILQVLYAQGAIHYFSYGQLLNDTTRCSFLSICVWFTLQQIITLMDRIMQQENLDLKLTTYRVLATSSRHGFVEYIESLAIADILANEGR